MSRLLALVGSNGINGLRVGIDWPFRDDIVRSVPLVSQSMSPEPISEVLRSLTSPKAMGAVFGASAAAIAFEHFGALTPHVMPYMKVIWALFGLSAAALVVHLLSCLGEKWSKHKDAQQKKQTSEEGMYGRYKKFSDLEKAVLRKFVERHEPALDLSEIVSNDEGLLAVRQLVQRGFLDGDIREMRWRDGMRTKVAMYREHYQSLMLRPDLIGSKAEPRDFGY